MPLGNSFVDEVYKALVSMQADLENEGTTPIAVLKKMDVLVTAVNIQRVRVAVDKLLAIDVLPGLSICQDGRIRAHQSATKH